MPGRHNVQNALAAIAVAIEMECPDETIRTGLAHFGGVRRRFTKVGEVNGATVIDDYAHHPVEIRAVLAAAREAVGATGGRVIAVVQPHRFTRLRDLMDLTGPVALAACVGVVGGGLLRGRKLEDLVGSGVMLGECRWSSTTHAPPTRAASHPDFHRRYRNSTGSTVRSRPVGLALAARGLSPPVRTCTDPGARFSCRF